MGNQLERDYDATDAEEFGVDVYDGIGTLVYLFLIVWFFFKRRLRGLVYGAPPVTGPLSDWAQQVVKKRPLAHAASTPLPHCPAKHECEPSSRQ